METAKMIRHFELLPGKSKVLVYELIMQLLPEETITQDDLNAHLEAISEFKQGLTTDINDINWD